MHLLYVPMNKKEVRLGFCWLTVLVLTSLPLRSGPVMELAFQGLHFAAAVLIFHRFLRSSFQVPLTKTLTIVKTALLGLILAQLANLLTNDLLFYFFPQYFFYNDTGPHFYNVLKEDILKEMLAENFPLTAFAVIVLAPIWEELFHRGLVFGTLARKHIALAYPVSIILYALLPILPLFGRQPAAYIVLSFIQHIPISVLFAWIYTRTETILTPVLAHMLMNAVSIFTMR